MALVMMCSYPRIGQTISRGLQPGGEQGESDVLDAAIEAAARCMAAGDKFIDVRLRERRGQPGVVRIEGAEATLDIEPALDLSEGIDGLAEVGRKAVHLGNQVAAGSTVAFGHGFVERRRHGPKEPAVAFDL